MNSTATYIAFFVLVSLTVLLIEVLLIPEVKKRKKKKKKSRKLEPTEIEIKLRESMERMDAKINGMSKEIEQFKAGEKKYQEMIEAEKGNVKALEEKIKIEREWHEKDQQETYKKSKEIQKMREEFKIEQENFSKEHTEFIKLEHELKRYKTELQETHNQKRALEREVAALKGAVEEGRKNISNLKADMKILTKKKEEESWIAKSEYTRLEKEVEKLQKQLERATRENAKEN